MVNESKKHVKEVKTPLGSKNLYLTLLNELKVSTNLLKIQEKHNISKQKLNYYLRELTKKGLITKRERGWYEVVKESKNSIKYGDLFTKDSVRGHAYIWTANLGEIPNGWKDRIEVLKKKSINYKLVGAKETTPRIKVLGRKVWLCNTHLRIFDKKEESYYGDNAIKSRHLAFQQIKLIVGALNKKLGTNIKPSDIRFQREHYALIKNDLAIEENNKGNIVRVSDEDGEWLLIDDSLGRGGELETIGKKALKTNVPMQKWWNDNKKHNFQITPSLLMEQQNKNMQMIHEVTQNQMMFAKNIEEHMQVLKDMRDTMKLIQKNLNTNI